MSFIKKYKTPLILVILSSVLYFYFAYYLQRSNFTELIIIVFSLFFLCYKLIHSKKISFWFLAGIGIFFRLLFLPSLPNLSQDFYRFIWDGRMLVKGINPYLFTPENIINNLSATLEVTKEMKIYEAQELYASMGNLNRSHYSNYPPINQLCFAIAALFAGKSILGSAIVMRILIILADIGILYFGKKLLENLDQNPKKIFWYFLNPFIIIELTGNLHFEAVMLFFMIWALYLLQQRKWIWAGVLFGISISVKLLPLLLLPLFFQWFMAKKEISISINLSKLITFYLIVIATVTLTFMPFYSSEFISNFSETIGLWFQNFEFNASVYYIIRWIGFKIVGWNIIASVGKILPLLVICFLLGITFFRKNKTFTQLLTSMLFGISVYFLLSTTVHPWYIASPLLLGVFSKYRFAIVWSALVMLSYSAYQLEDFSENLWFVATEYSIVIGFFIWEVFASKKPNNFFSLLTTKYNK